MNIRGRKINIRRERLNHGGYTRSGHYFGTGAPLFQIEDDETGRTLYIRARDRAAAIKAVNLEDPSNPSNSELRYFWSKVNEARPNPIGTKTVLLGVAALGALAAVFYAVNASAKPATLTTGTAPPNPTAGSGTTASGSSGTTPTSGSSPAPLNPVGTNQNEV